VLLSLLAASILQSSQLQYRWVYVAQNLQVAENVGKVQALLKRAKDAGYNGIVLADYKLSILDQVPGFYAQNVEKVKASAKELGIDIYPAVFGIGYSSGLLSHDPNLAEGMPVRDLAMVVRNGVAEIAPEEQVQSQNLDFEASLGDKMSGWGFQDDIGKSTFADRQNVFHGSQSLRMSDIGKVEPESGNCRVSQLAEVKPWHQYHVSVAIKTQDFDHAGEARIQILTELGKGLSFAELGVKPTQDWTRHHIVFNSQDNTKVRLYFGVWGGRNGTIWWDDGKFEPVAFLNVLRREGCPLSLSPLKEGADFDPIKDPKMGNVPWPGSYEVFHDSPKAKVKGHEEERLTANYYHVAYTLEDQVAICLSEPKTYQLLQNELDSVIKLIQPKGFLMSHDEIRVANWCAACTKRGLTPGQMLADNARKCTAIIRKSNPKAEVFVWSDMFDPNHNAHGDYYLVNGSWANSWQGLDKDVTVVNWHFGARKQSLPFFAGRGHKQILAGYYDGPVSSIKTWLEDAKGVSGIVGVMYTTWQGDYSNLEAFSKAAWGGK
jgi:hypothetical protein